MTLPYTQWHVLVNTFLPTVMLLYIMCIPDVLHSNTSTLTRPYAAHMLAYMCTLSLLLTVADTLAGTHTLSPVLI